jgi:hypothetical protein
MHGRDLVEGEMARRLAIAAGVAEARALHGELEALGTPDARELVGAGVAGARTRRHVEQAHFVLRIRLRHVVRSRHWRDGHDTDVARATFGALLHCAMLVSQSASALQKPSCCML